MQKSYLFQETNPLTLLILMQQLKPGISLSEATGTQDRSVQMVIHTGKGFG
jgi:hypothetical protein